jgi:predicted AAA+ superfamily ATPase
MISKEMLKEVLLEQHRRVERMKKEEFVQREKLSEVGNFVGLKSSIIITGVRRCGKSVFLSQIMRKFFESAYYINFEDERLSAFDLNDFNKLYETCIELWGRKNAFFLDEVQNINGWEKWVRRMYEDGFKFFITGSNARLLSKELATLLTGRHLQFSLFPLSFREFLNFHKFGLKKDDLYLTERRAMISKYLSEYLEKGGFPEYLKYLKIEILQGYFNDIVQRDIAERYKVANIKQLKELARYIITNTGNLTTYNSLKKLTGAKSVNTVIKYFSYMENAYLTFAVPLFSYSLKTQARGPFKVYAIDTGLRNSMSLRFSKDTGRLYETLVAIELKRRGKEFYHWKNSSHEEVDFILKNGQKIEQLIQVCYDAGDHATEKRELKSLLKAGKELKCRNMLVVTGDRDEEVATGKNKIRYIPLWKWLLK